MAALQPAAPFRLSPTRFGLLVNRFERNAARVQGYFDRHGPGLGLYILSPVVAELVLGSSPPLTFLFFGWIDLLMYGGGAVIIRELVRRWGKGWPSILALGVAYGIAEEGLAIRSFFNPNWGGAVGLAGYGFVASILVCWAILPYAIGGAALFGCVAAMAVCYVVARRLPARVSWPVGWGSSGARPAPKPTTVLRLSLAVTTLSFVLVFARGFGLPFGVASVLLVTIVLAMAAWLLRASAGIGWSDRHSVAVPLGVMAFFVGFSPLVELTGGHGQLVVGLVTAVVLRRTWVSMAASTTD